MVIAMFLAHLVGDYLLQWWQLALWKSREIKGVLVHGMIVLAATWLISLPFDPGFWPWVLFICGIHLLIDATPVLLARRFPRLMEGGQTALWRLIIDQTAHVIVILLALIWSGYLQIPSLLTDLAAAIESHRTLTYVLGYVAISAPGWILVEFLAFGLINKTPPDFSQATNKYIGILERGLITTFVLFGQFILVPLVTVPRLIIDEPKNNCQQQRMIYLTELLVSISLAVAIGLLLRQL